MQRIDHHHSLSTSFPISNDEIFQKQFVNNFGFTLDCHVIMNKHVSTIVLTCYLELRRLTSIRRYIEKGR